MIVFAIPALAGPTTWTGRTPIGDVEVTTEQVQLIHESLEISLTGLDDTEVRAVYQVHNPGESVVVRYGVPLTSGGPDGGQTASANAASVRILQNGEFVPCLVQPGRRIELPTTSESGMHIVDRWCTADLVFAPGLSEIRMSFEGGLLFERQMGEDAPTGADRQLVHLLGLAGSWGGQAEQIDVLVNLGPTYAGRAREVSPEPMNRSEQTLSWSFMGVDVAEVAPVLSVKLAAADLDVLAAASHSPKVFAPTIAGAEALTDGDPNTAWCGPIDEPLALRWTTPPPGKACRIGLSAVPGDPSTGVMSWITKGRVTSIELSSCGASSVSETVRFPATQTPSVATVELPDALAEAWFSSEQCMNVSLGSTLPKNTAEACMGELSWQVDCSRLKRRP